MTDGAKNLGDNGISTYTFRTDSFALKKFKTIAQFFRPKS